jgi:hypothetical protein
MEDDIEEEGEEGPDEMVAGNDRTATAENLPVSKPGLLFLYAQELRFRNVPPGTVWSVRI